MALINAGHPDTIAIFPEGTRMAQDAAGSPRHVFRTSGRELARITGGEIAHIKETT